jgi:hypothetical protein
MKRINHTSSFHDYPQLGNFLRASLFQFSVVVLGVLCLVAIPASATTNPTEPSSHMTTHISWPTDWAGSSFCSSHYGAPYLGNDVNGVAACGTQYFNKYSNLQGAISYNNVTFDTDGFQCVELAARYFFAATGLKPPSGNGDEYAWKIWNAYPQNGYGLSPTGQFGSTSSYQNTLQAGDIISMWSRSDESPGHVAVVKSVLLNASLTGTIWVLDENASSFGNHNGLDPITVTSGVMNYEGLYNYFQWVYGLPVPNFSQSMTPPATTPTGNPMIDQAHNLCLDAAAQSLSKDGGTVQLWQCVGDTNQQWYAVGNELRNKANGKCLDANWSTDAANGGKVQMWACNNGANQQWVANGKMMVNQAHKLCLDANWGTDGNNGGIVQLWSCNNGVNQQWGASSSTPSPQNSYTYNVVAPNGTLNERTSPSTGAALVGSLPNGAPIHIVCQTSGSNVQGSVIWDKLTNNYYVSDYYTSTPGNMTWSTPIPRC